MPVIFIQERDVHFQDTMKALPQTIVFIHGAGGSHHTWRDQWAGLKSTARLVIPDLPGHAGSLGTPKGSIEAYAEWLAEFVAEVELGPFVLAGHSMGGAIALKAAMDNIKGLKALILVGTGAKLKVSPAIIEGITSRFEEFAPELVDWMIDDSSGPLLRDDINRDVLSTPPAIFLSDFRACDVFDVRDRLGRVDVPTLVVVGDADRLTPPKYSVFLATHIRGAVLKILPGAGHVPMLERPTEVNNVIASFVRSLE